VKTIHKTYRFALLPTKEQEVLLNKHFGCARFVFNYFLNERIRQYRESKKSDNYHKQASSLTLLKRQEATRWLKEVNSQALQAALRHLDISFQNFFRGIAKFPRFKSKRKKNSFSIPQFVAVCDGKLYFPKFKEGIKLIEHRRMKGSNSRDRQRLKVAAIHEKVANTRLDLLHKVSARITNEYDTICLEDLNVKGMVANRRLAKHIGDAGWGIFIRLLEYKAEWNNKQVVKINRFYPSSKTCSECGYIHQALTLSERTWTCPDGHILDRDINASKNILAEGLRIIGAELSDYTDGGSDQTSEKKHKPMKSEAH